MTGRRWLLEVSSHRDGGREISHDRVMDPLDRPRCIVFDVEQPLSSTSAHLFQHQVQRDSHRMNMNVLMVDADAAYDRGERHPPAVSRDSDPSRRMSTWYGIGITTEMLHLSSCVWSLAFQVLNRQCEADDVEGYNVSSENMD